MNSLATSTVQLDSRFVEAPSIRYFAKGDFFSIWWGHGLSLILSPEQLRLLKAELRSTPTPPVVTGAEAACDVAPGAQDPWEVSA